MVTVKMLKTGVHKSVDDIVGGYVHLLYTGYQTFSVFFP